MPTFFIRTSVFALVFLGVEGAVVGCVGISHCYLEAAFSCPWFDISGSEEDIEGRPEDGGMINYLSSQIGWKVFGVDFAFCS